MDNIRNFRILFPSADNILPDGDFAGYVGEHNATLLEITPPKEMTDCEDIATYRIAFELTNCRAVHSDSIPKAASISMLLPAQVTSSKVISVQLEGYSTDNNLVAKSEKISKIKFYPSVCGVETGADNKPFGIVAEVTANTQARHKHSNAAVLDSLSDSGGTLQYNGKPISGVTVDSKLSGSSTNPVQNKVVKVKFDATDKKITEVVNKASANETAIKDAEKKIPENSELLKRFSDGGVLLYNGIPVGEKPTASIVLSVLDNGIETIVSDIENKCTLIQFYKTGIEIPAGTKIETIEFLINGKWIDIHGMAEFDRSPCALALHKVFLWDEYFANVLAAWSPINAVANEFAAYNVSEIRITYSLPKISFYVDDVLHHIEYADINSAVQLPEEPEKDGYSLLGWIPEGSAEIAEFPYTVGGEDIRFDASFRATPYTATFYADGVEFDRVNYVAGESITADIPTKTGYEFIGWNPEIPDAMPAENTSFNALWQAKNFDAVFMVDGEVYKTVPTVFGEQIATPLAPSKTGYTFNGWNPAVGTMNTESKTFEALWKIKQTDVYFTDGDTVVQKVTVDYNSQVNAIADPTKQYYTFTGWKDDSGNSADFPITAGENDIYLYAEWVHNEVTVVFYDSILNSVPEILYEKTYKCGDPIEPPAFTPPEGYVFLGWANVKTNPESTIYVFPAAFYEENRLPSIAPDDGYLEYYPLCFEGGYIEAEEGYNDSANVWFLYSNNGTHYVGVGGTGSLDRSIVNNTPWRDIIAPDVSYMLMYGHGITEIGEARAVNLYLPSTLNKILLSTFDNISPSIHYEGTEEQWAEIEIGANNDGITIPEKFNNPRIII